MFSMQFYAFQIKIQAYKCLNSTKSFFDQFSSSFLTTVFLSFLNFGIKNIAGFLLTFCCFAFSLELT